MVSLRGSESLHYGKLMHLMMFDFNILFPILILQSYRSYSCVVYREVPAFGVYFFTYRYCLSMLNNWSVFKSNISYSDHDLHITENFNLSVADGEIFHHKSVAQHNQETQDNQAVNKQPPGEILDGFYHSFTLILLVIVMMMMQIDTIC